MPTLLRAQRFVGVAICVAALAPVAARPHGQDVKMEGYPAIGAPSVVTLLSPGAEPRVKLRYSVPATYKGTMVSTTTIGMTMVMAGMEMPMNVPATTSSADLTVTNVAANGDLSFTMAMGGVSAPPAGGDPALAATLQSMDADIKTLKGTATISDRGVKRASTFDTSKVTNPQFKETLDSLRSVMENVSMPLPEEAIGVGAKWEIRLAIAASGLTMFEKLVLEVVSIDGKVITLKVSGDMTAPPQTMNNPALPPGAEARVLNSSGTVSGNQTLRLDELISPSVLNNQINMDLQISMNGQIQTMSMKTTTKIEIAPKKG
jgi:hypothetical protein